MEDSHKWVNHVHVITSTNINKTRLVNRTYSSSNSHIFDTFSHEDSVNNKYNVPSSKQKKGGDVYERKD